MGKLYVVPTPVGNLEDMTFRAIRILKEVDLILAEDTRTSGILLKHFEIKNAMQSHHKFNEHKTVESVVNRIKGGETVALISDAGTPGVRGEVEGTDRGDEGRDCGSEAADGFGRGRWKSAGRKEGQSGKEEKLIKLFRVSNIWYPRQLSIKYDCLA